MIDEHTKRQGRYRVAREAARLIYYNYANEYNTAKAVAARSVNERRLPSNMQVALELDSLASQLEGAKRRTLIVTLRRKALQLMQYLQTFHPRLIGSVWRGTARKGSDIDIEVFCQDLNQVVERLRELSLTPRIEHSQKTDQGKTDHFLHMYFQFSQHPVEIIIRDLADINETRRCEIYNDVITGISLTQLERILEEDPLKRFVPKER